MTKRKTSALAGVLCLAFAMHLSAMPSSTDLVNLGSGSFSVDPSATTAAYAQSTSSLNFAPTAVLGDTLGGIFASQNWGAYVSFGLRMSTTDPALPPLPFTVQFYDSAFDLIGTYTATTSGLSLTPTVVLLGRVLGGEGDFANVVGMQFTWDGGGSLNVAISEVVGFSPPSSGFFVARAPGGVQFVTSNFNDVELVPGGGVWRFIPPSTATLNSLPPGATAWAVLSDANLKSDVSPVDHQALLAGLDKLAVTKWSYSAEPTREHYGPMAQDFRRAFGLGGDERRISTLDADGVTLAALKGLISELQTRKERSAEQARRLASLQAEMADLLERVAASGH